MANEYVSRKSDASSKIPTQRIPGKTWTLLEVEGEKVIIPKSSSDIDARWAYYLNVDVPLLGGASEILVRWVRNPKQLYKKAVVGDLHDITGQHTNYVKAGKKFFASKVWIFKALKGQPVGIEIYHNGSKPITINTRESKMGHS